MDRQLQQRLTGAAIIIALAVIFIPELVEQPEPAQSPVPAPAMPPPSETPTTTISLDPPAPLPVPDVAIDESGIDETGSEETIAAELPELPPLAEAELPLDAEPVDSELPFDQPSEVNEAPAPVEQVRAPTTPPASEPAPVRTEPPRRTETPPRVEPPRRDPAPAQPAERVAAIAPPPEPALPPLELISRPMGQSGGQSGGRTRAQTQPRWMVQAGSFSNVDNANSLRNRLRSSNFSASLQQTVVDGRTMYRVHVGPHSSREESERTRERLQRELNINGSVVPVYN